MTNIIGDIAGRYTELLELVDLMPKGEVISVGDMVDRGPDSKRVLEYFMREGCRAILGNHEHLMLDHLLKGGFYGRGTWLMNGGYKTISSFEGEEIPIEILEWISKLPKYIEFNNIDINGTNKNVLVSHAFLGPTGENDRLDLEDDCNFGDNIYTKHEATIIWNRSEPHPKETWDLQICGHNSQFGLREWENENGTYAICLDDSRQEKLTGLHLETMTVYQVPYK